MKHGKPNTENFIMSNSKKRSGFTLVELLVVIAIISILAGLAIPAVNMARESARRATCANNLGQLGKAIQSYELSKKKYPGWINNVGGQPASWPVTILKNIDRADVYDVWREGNPNVEPSKVYVGLFVCPSSGLKDQEYPLSYVANCGQQDANSGMNFGDKANGIPPDWASNGVFFRDFCPNPINNKNFIHVRMASTDIKDGMQYTFLLSENLQAGNWANINETTGEKSACTEGERLNGMVWWTGGFTPAAQNVVEQYLRINANLETERSTVMSGTSFNYSRPSSYHPGGVNAVFCDAHAQFLSEGMDFSVYAKLMATDDKQVLYAGQPKVTPPTAATNTLRTLLQGKLSEEDLE